MFAAGPAVAIDASEVRYLDRSAMDSLIEARLRCMDHGGDLTLVAPSAAARIILELSGRYDALNPTEAADRHARDAGERDRGMSTVILRPNPVLDAVEAIRLRDNFTQCSRTADRCHPRPDGCAGALRGRIGRRHQLPRPGQANRDLRPGVAARGGVRCRPCDRPGRPRAIPGSGRYMEPPSGRAHGTSWHPHGPGFRGSRGNRLGNRCEASVLAS